MLTRPSFRCKYLIGLYLLYVDALAAFHSSALRTRLRQPPPPRRNATQPNDLTTKSLTSNAFTESRSPDTVRFPCRTLAIYIRLYFRSSYHHLSGTQPSQPCYCPVKLLQALRVALSPELNIHSTLFVHVLTVSCLKTSSQPHSRANTQLKPSGPRIPRTHTSAGLRARLPA